MSESWNPRMILNDEIKTMILQNIKSNVKILESCRRLGHPIINRHLVLNDYAHIGRWIDLIININFLELRQGLRPEERWLGKGDVRQILREGFPVGANFCQVLSKTQIVDQEADAHKEDTYPDRTRNAG